MRGNDRGKKHSTIELQQGATSDLGNNIQLNSLWVPRLALVVKNLPVMQETWVSSGRSTGEGIGYPLQYSWASLVAQQVKNPPATWEAWILSLDWEDALEKRMATHSSILAWRIP